MAAKLGTVTLELLVRPRGSDAEPTVVGELTIDLDAKAPKHPDPIMPIPDPPAPLPEFMLPQKKGRR